MRGTCEDDEYCHDVDHSKQHRNQSLEALESTCAHVRRRKCIGQAHTSTREHVKKSNSEGHDKTTAFGHTSFSVSKESTWFQSERSMLREYNRGGLSRVRVCVRVCVRLCVHMT